MPLVIENDTVYSDTLDFIEINPTTPSIDDYALDDLTRIYEGRNSLLDAFLATWVTGAGVPKLTIDLQYPGMAAVGRPSVTRGRTFSQVAVKFTGKISDAEPLTTMTPDIKSGTIQVEGVTSSSPPVPGTAVATYLAESRSYHYFSKTLPTTPRYPNGGYGSFAFIATITAGAHGQITTSTPTNYTVGQTVYIQNVSGGITDINGFQVVDSIIDSLNFTIIATVGTGGSGGSASVQPAAGGITITALRGSVALSSGVYPITSVSSLPPAVATLMSWPRITKGIWYDCTENWEWAYQL